MSSHRFWEIPELLRLLIAQISEFYPQYDSRRPALARCARVSRILSTHALSSLWEFLSSLEPLVKLLPSSFRAVRVGRSTLYPLLDTVYVSHAPILDEEWARFLHYGDLVREIHLVSPRSGRAGSSNLVQAILVDRARGAPLFPHLRILHWDRSQGLPLLHQALTPGLRAMNLNLRLDKDRDTLQGTLQLVCSRVPTLTELDLRNVMPGSTLSPISSFVNLRALSIHGPQPLPAAMQCCAGLERLARLSIWCSPEKDEGTAYATGFRSLQELDFHGPSECLSIFLAAITSQSLRSISASVAEAVECLRRCAELLASRWSSSLRSIDLELNATPAGSPGVSLFASTFAPLYALPELECVRFTRPRFTNLTPVELALEDGDVGAMAQAWPKLVGLCWDVVIGCDVRHPGFASLAAFAEHCPRLRALELDGLDFGALFARESERPPPRSSSHALEKFVVKSAVLSGWDDLPVAKEAVYRLFPHIKEFQLSGMDWDDEFDADWY